MLYTVVIGMEERFRTGSQYQAFKRFVSETKELVRNGTSVAILFEACWVGDYFRLDAERAKQALIDPNFDLTTFAFLPMNFRTIIESAHARGWMADGRWINSADQEGGSG